MLPTIELQHIPDSARAAFNTWFDDFRQADRGSIRNANDKTLESRAHHFACWLERNGCDYESLQAIPEEQTLA